MRTFRSPIAEVFRFLCSPLFGVRAPDWAAIFDNHPDREITEALLREEISSQWVDGCDGGQERVTKL